TGAGRRPPVPGEPGTLRSKGTAMKKEMLINVLQAEECRIAILENGTLEELYVERSSHESYVGNIYKGRIVNIEPSIQAAFVDFGVGRNGFLHISDVEPTYYRHLESRFGDGDRDLDRDFGRGRDRDRDRDYDRGRDRDRGRGFRDVAEGEEAPRSRPGGNRPRPMPTASRPAEPMPAPPPPPRQGPPPDSDFAAGVDFDEP